MSFVSDFKAFAMKGNIVDLAVGIIIGIGLTHATFLVGYSDDTSHGIKRRARVSKSTTGVAGTQSRNGLPQMFYVEQLWKSLGGVLITGLLEVFHRCST